VPRRVKVRSRLRAFGQYLRDPNASLLGKLSVLASALYVVWPADLIPDVPVVGWLDDLGVMTVAMAFLARTVGRYREIPEDDANDGLVPDRPSSSR
jgi:uncharacterized membrane protein YkvA (DUF1232 family)